MATTKVVRVSQVTFGGDASDNPPDYSYSDFHNYPGLPTGQQYTRQNVIYNDPNQVVTYKVTGLLVLGQDGKPLTGPNDLCYLPCPPNCQ